MTEDYASNPNVISLEHMDVREDHESAAFKQYLGIQWIMANYDPDFLYVAGSDVHVNVPNMLRLVDQFNPTFPFYIGNAGLIDNCLNSNVLLHDGGPGFILTSETLKRMKPHLNGFQERWIKLINIWYPHHPAYRSACDVSMAILCCCLGVYHIKVLNAFINKCRSDCENIDEIVACHGYW